MGTMVPPDTVAFDVSLRGYRMDDVDDFLDRVASTLSGLERENQWLQEALASPGSDPKGSAMYFDRQGHLRPDDVRRQKFRVSFKGYNERQVDQYLDQVIEALGRALEENDRLREAAGVGG
jgi:DivIVA domain-containing protein